MTVLKIVVDRVLVDGNFGCTLFIEYMISSYESVAGYSLPKKVPVYLIVNKNVKGKMKSKKLAFC